MTMQVDERSISTVEIEAKEKDALERVTAWEITCDDDYRALDLYIVGLKDLEKSIISNFRRSKATALEAHRAICAQEDGHLDHVKEARKLGKTKIDAWQVKMEAVRAAEEARLRAEAKKKAEDEALAKAERAAEFGDEKGADAIMAAPVIVAPVVVAPIQKSATVIRTIWKARVVDPNKVPREYCIPNEKALNGLARATKGAVKVEGVEFYSEKC